MSEHFIVPNTAQRAIIDDDICEVISTDLPWSHFDDATILVTGANGFLPAYMVETLLQLVDRKIVRNARVLALVRSLGKAKARFQRWLASPALVFLEQDVSAPLGWSGPIDFVIHAASQASPKYYGTDPIGTALPNVVGTATLLDAAARRGCRRFLYFSSSEVYGITARETGDISEVDFGPLDPTVLRSVYAESKRMGESLCTAYHHQTQLKTVIVRPFHTYGPGMAMDDGRVFADLVRDVVLGRDIVLNSAGTAERAFCYLRDATAGIFTVLLTGQSPTAYNVGNPAASSSILELAQLLARISEKTITVKVNSSVASGYIASRVERVVPDINRLLNLGWQPKTSLSTGFTRTVSYYCAGDR